MPKMGIAHKAPFIHQDLGGHPPQLEKTRLFPKALQDAVGRVGQADEGNAVVLPVLLEGFSVVRANHQHLGIICREVM